MGLYGGEKINVCVVGGGNIGTLILGDIGIREDISLRLFTSRPEQWENKIEVWHDNTIKHIGKIDLISNNPVDVISDADIIIFTLPSHIFPKVIDDIKEFIKPGTIIGIIPGSGGGEFFCRELIEKGCIIFGFQRVHGISRIKEYGKSVYDLGRKSELYIATIPSRKVGEICKIIEEIFYIKCNCLPNYLNVTLAPSNPILHTTRLYSMFKDYKDGVYWNEKIKFYEEWNDNSSSILISCDSELQKICENIRGLDLKNVKSLKSHYDVETVTEMTEKITSISAFKGINAPMKYTTEGYIPDLNSRYFLEDFLYGLCIIKGFGDILKIDTPNIDEVLRFYERISGYQIYKDEKFDGNDLKKLPLPNNYGLKNMDDIVSYYEYF